MYSNLTKHRKNIAVLALLIAIVMVSLSGRLGYLMLFCSEHYSAMAEDLHQRERTIKAARGRIIDANGVVIADNRTVCTISVIYNQVKDREQVIRVLCDELDLDEELVRKRVEKRSSRKSSRPMWTKSWGTRYVPTGWQGSRWMRTTNGIIPTTAWHPRSWDLPGETTRALSAWK